MAIADDQLDEVIDIVRRRLTPEKLATAKSSSLNCNASFVFVPAKPTKRRCNLWHTATGTKNEDSDDKNWACFTGDAAGTGNGCTCGGR
ncbi:hypothetical protein ACVXHA_02115 [Escherichia coli]